MKAFFDQYNINGHEDLIKIITEYNNNLIIESDTLKKFKEIEHNLIINKLDMLSIKNEI